MTTPERFDVWRQRAALSALAESMEFLNSAEGLAFLDQIKVHFAPSIVGLARKNGFPMDHDEVVNGAIELLVLPDPETKEPGRVARYAASADQEPWGYLFGCLHTWARQQWGHRCWVELETLDYLPQPPDPDKPTVTIAHAIQQTFEILAPHTDEEHHDGLHDLIGWLASNRPQRASYRKDEKIAAHRSCPSLTTVQIEAIMNICWGGRGNLTESSILYALLDGDGDWRISDSGSHTRALLRYSKKMRAGKHAGRSLTDWSN